MLVPLSMLQNYVDISDIDIKDFVDKITMVGLNVEELKLISHDIKNIIVGKAVDIEKHPNADKLVVVTVDIGKEEDIKIVTSAENVLLDGYMPVAVDGAVLSGDFKIKKTKMRGVESNGMICSVEELGFDKHDFPNALEGGIYVFEKDYPIGSDALLHLDIVDEVIEIETTSNRVDTNSVIGVAREVAAAFNKEVKYPKNEVKNTLKEDINDYISVEIENEKLCNRYVARIVKNVKLEPSPRWMRKHLRNAGIRPINNIVDITNYVLLEYGQPMHAFDLDGVSENKIIVRSAKKGEKIITLDEEERKLDEDILLITDPEKAIGIAGVMGGENSKVSDGAKAILFESANFLGSNIRLTSKKLGLRSESSALFEKGLDPNLALTAINRAMELVEELGCGEVLEGIVDIYPNKREENQVKYNPESINALLGTDIPEADMIKYFESLELKVDTKNKIVSAPTFRPDICIENDLAEEVARLFGYDNIKTTLARGSVTIGRRNRKQLIERKIKQALIAEGFSEALIYSFESPDIYDKLLLDSEKELENAIKIRNPLGEDFSIMRTNTVNGILNSISTNYNRRNSSAKLFELGKTYIAKSLPLTELPNEKNYLTLAAYEDGFDFYRLKGVLENLFLSLDIEAKYDSISNLNFMHPGRTAKVFEKKSNEDIAYLGEVHPLVLSNYDISTKVYLAIISLDKIFEFANLKKEYKGLTKYPSITRDISIVLNEDIVVGKIEDIIETSAGKYLESFKLFDLYTGSNIEKGKKSVAYSIVFRSDEKTLADEDINEAMKKIVSKLESEVDAKLRDK